jgi:hypothetical protein
VAAELWVLVVAKVVVVPADLDLSSVCLALPSLLVVI